MYYIKKILLGDFAIINFFHYFKDMINSKLKIFLLIFLFSNLSGCNTNKTYEINGNAFGTIYYISIENDKTINQNEIYSNKDGVSLVKYELPIE